MPRHSCFFSSTVHLSIYGLGFIRPILLVLSSSYIFSAIARKILHAMEQSQTNAQPQHMQYKHRDGRAPNPQHLAIALHHANQIQAQKDAEAFILDRILELIELPSSPSANAAAPSPADVAALKAALVPFQPTDLDNLVLERNIEGRCGYTLCPHKNRKEDSNAKFRIVWGPKGGADHGSRGREMKIVSREKLEMWCSEACAERAMYLRLQLVEDPVWERRAGDGATKQVTLLEEARALQKTKKAVKSEGDRHQRLNAAGSVALEDKMEALALKANSDAEGSKQLAVERGDSNSAFQQDGRVDIQILEKEPDVKNANITAPSPRPGDQTGGSIEGYVPHTGDHIKSRNGPVQDEGNDDVLDSL
jgi:hypothetical protein